MEQQQMQLCDKQEELQQQQQQQQPKRKQNSQTTDNQSQCVKVVSNERRGGISDDCAVAGTSTHLETEVGKSAGSENPITGPLEFRDQEQLGELNVSVESSPEVWKDLTLNPLTGLPDGWQRTKHERPTGSSYFHLKPVGSKILRSQVEVNSYVQQQGIKLKISLKGPVTQESPKKKINLKKRFPLLPSSSEELEEKGEEGKSEGGLSTTNTSLEGGANGEGELRALLEERNIIYKIPSSERTAAQNTRIDTLQKKIKRLKKKFPSPSVEVTKALLFKKTDEKNEKLSKVVEQTKNQEKNNEKLSATLERQQDEKSSKETKRKMKKKKVPITPAEVFEDDEDEINDKTF